jgi:hypothetical protein
MMRDARHKDVELLHFEEIDERRFGGWTMGVVNLSKLNHSILLKYPSGRARPLCCLRQGVVCAAGGADGHRIHHRPGEPHR